MALSILILAEWAMPPKEGFERSNLMVYCYGKFTIMFADQAVPPVSEIDSSIKDSADSGRLIVTNTKNGQFIASQVYFSEDEIRDTSECRWAGYLVELVFLRRGT